MVINEIKITLPTTPNSTTITIDDNSLISYDFPINSRSNIEQPCWGLITNKGSIEFIDRNNVFLDYIDSGVLVSGCPVVAKIYVDTIYLYETIFEGITVDWDYDPTTKRVSVSVGDTLSQFQSIEFAGYDLTESKTAYDLYNVLRSASPNTSSGHYNIQGAALGKLQQTVVPYPYIERGSLWNAWQKLADLCCLCVYVDRFSYSSANKIVLKYAIGG